MKLSNTLKLLRQKLQTVPADKINLDQYRSNRVNGRIESALFISPYDCGECGCVIGHGALSPALSPHPDEYLRAGDCLDWDRYTQRLFNLADDDSWMNHRLLRLLFDGARYSRFMDDEDRKAEILFRLRSAEIALQKNRENMYLAAAELQ